jgi:hypothetical protein
MSHDAHNYTRYSDAELRDLVGTLPFEEQPNNARSLATELEQRWSREAQRSASLHSDVSLTKGASFSDLEPSSARAFFWRFVSYSLVLSIICTAITFAVFIALAIVIGVVARIRTGSASGLQMPSSVLYLISALITLVPLTAYCLRRITARRFGSYALKIVKAADNASPKEGREGHVV